jgi:purine catabolism regulator
MIISDLLAADALQLRLHTPSTAERLAREISWCAPTEIMDPTPFLSPNVLLLTNGIGLNVEDDRTWSAYVERLVGAGVAAIAFGTGTAHRLVPSGLVRAAAEQEMPLLEIPRAVPFLQVHRYVTNVLQAEYFAATTRSWELAEVCAELASSGKSLAEILGALARETGAEIAIFDVTGAVIAGSSDGPAWSDSHLAGVAAGRREGVVPLPMGGGDSFHLVARGSSAEHPVATLLGPAASIIAVQLQTALSSASHKEQELERLLDMVPDWNGVALEEFSRGFAATGLDPARETFVMTAMAGHSNLSHAWRLRLLLQESFRKVRLVVRAGVLHAFAQVPERRDDGARAVVVDELFARIGHAMPGQPLVLKGPCGSVDEFRLAVHQTGGMVGSVVRPTLAPELAIGSLVASSVTHGARTSAQKLLAPVIAYDQEHVGHLLPTLRAYLAHDCQPSRACASLFIHRNTLSQRLAKLERLLKLPLSTLEGQATCLMALRIVET